jgi:hypothetical protein
LSGWSGVGSALSKPGKKKLAGETLWVVLMPLQPAQNQITAGNTNNHRHLYFQFIFT